MRDRLEKCAEAEAKMRQHEHAEQRSCRPSAARFDDLHPGRGEHSAEHDIDDHQQADADTAVLIADARPSAAA